MAAAYGLLDRLQIEVRGRDEGYVVAEVERYVQLVGREEYALVLSVRQLGQKRAQFVAVGHVEEGRGLVEQDHGCLLRQRTRYHDTLALAVRHAVHRAVGIVGHFRVVGDQHDGLAVFPGKAPDHLHDLNGGFRIQVAGGFVGEHHVRPGQEGAGDARPLLLAAGHLAGIVMQPVGQAHLAKHSGGSPLPLGPGYAPEHKGQGHVFHGGQGGQQVIGLKHESQMLLPEFGQRLFGKLADGDPADGDLAPGGLFHTGQLIEQRAFAGARGAEDTADLAPGNGQVDGLEGHHHLFPYGIFLAQGRNLDKRCFAGSFHKVPPFAAMV